MSGFVKGNMSAVQSGASAGLALSGSTPAGNLIYVSIAQVYGVNPPASITSVADSVDGANLTLVASETHFSGTTVRIDTYARIAVTGGTRTITVTLGAAADWIFAIDEYDTYTSKFGSATHNWATGTSIQPGSINAGQTALFINSTCKDQNAAATTKDAAYTQRHLHDDAAGPSLMVCDRISAAAENPTTTFSVSGDLSAILAAYYSPTPIGPPSILASIVREVAA